MYSNPRLGDTGSIPVYSTMGNTYEDNSHDERIGFRTYETPFGLLTVYTKDEPGPKGNKAGTTKMVYNDGPPRPMRLKKKYRARG